MMETIEDLIESLPTPAAKENAIIAAAVNRGILGNTVLPVTPKHLQTALSSLFVSCTDCNMLLTPENLLMLKPDFLRQLEAILVDRKFYECAHRISVHLNEHARSAEHLIKQKKYFEAIDYAQKQCPDRIGEITQSAAKHIFATYYLISEKGLDSKLSRRPVTSEENRNKLLIKLYEECIARKWELPAGQLQSLLGNHEASAQHYENAFWFSNAAREYLNAGKRLEAVQTLVSHGWFEEGEKLIHTLVEEDCSLEEPLEKMLSDASEQKQEYFIAARIQSKRGEYVSALNNYKKLFEKREADLNSGIGLAAHDICKIVNFLFETDVHQATPALEFLMKHSAEQRSYKLAHAIATRLKSPLADTYALFTNIS